MTEEKKTEDLYVQNCPSCGIVFGIPKEMEPIWRNNHNSFHCPNGHSLSWSAESPKDKEHRLRLKEVEDLKAKLADVQKELTAQKKKVEELQAELEIWRPSSADTTEKKDGSHETGTGN